MDAECLDFSKGTDEISHDIAAAGGLRVLDARKFY